MENEQKSESTLKVAIVGCVHGELDAIYDTLLYIEKSHNVKTDLLLCCGDFQAIRNQQDLHSLAVPHKYRQMNSFYKYYSEEKVAPITTIFIGGNHEASNHLQELYHGGWVAPNIYYMGAAGVLNYAGIRIAGLSGIFKGYSFRKGHFEKQPFDDSAVRSIYHVREQEILQLFQITRPLDVFLSHDWPQGIIDYGQKERLFNVKKFLREEETTLGNPATMRLLKKLQPSYWFAGHMHVKFPAIVSHGQQQQQHQAESLQQTEESSNEKTTKFLALSKVLPNQDFLQVIDIPYDGHSPKHLSYDLEWLLILQSTRSLLSDSPNNVYLPHGYAEAPFRVTDDQLTAAQAILSEDSLVVPNNFIRTAEIYNPSNNRNNNNNSITTSVNPQTEALMELLEKLAGIKAPVTNQPTSHAIPVAPNPEEIPLEEDDDTVDDENRVKRLCLTPQLSQAQPNPEEIVLDDE